MIDYDKDIVRCQCVEDGLVYLCLVCYVIVGVMIEQDYEDGIEWLIEICFEIFQVIDMMGYVCVLVCDQV